MARLVGILAMVAVMSVSRPLRADEVSAIPYSCRAFGYYTSAGLWLGASVTPERSAAAGFELAAGARVHQCSKREQPLLELRIGGFVRYLANADLGGTALGGELELSSPLVVGESRIGGHVQLGVAAADSTKTLLYGAAGVRLRRGSTWLGLDVIATRGQHRDDTSTGFSRRTGVGPVIGAGFEGRGATVLVVLGAIVGGFLVFVAATSE